MKKKSTRLARPLLILALVALMAITVASVGAAGRSNARPVSVPTDNVRSYVVLMEGLPLAAYDGEISGLPATKATQGQKLDAQTAAAKAYDAHLRGKQAVAISSVGLSEKAVTNSYTVALNGFSALMTEAQVEAMRRQDGVQTVLEDQWRQPDTDSSGAFLGLAGYWGPWYHGVNGEGVLVGVIDTGIWPEHPSFADDGTLPAAPVLDNSRPNCEFGNTTHNPNDAPFTCNNKLVGARQMLDTYRALTGATDEEYDSARDDGGHGTHTASTAAGNANVKASILGIRRGKVSGIAPRAQVVAYKGLGALGGYTSDLAAAIDQAVADGVDVINYSVGGGAGGPGADEIAFLFAADAGVYVATSAGNSGPGAATLGNPGTMPWMTTVGASTQPRFFQGSIILKKVGKTGKPAVFSGASITASTKGYKQLVDAEDAGGELCLVGTLDPTIVAGKIVLCRRGGSARADKSRAVYQAGGAGMIMYNNSDVDNLATDTHWVPSVHIDQTPGLAIKAYIAENGAKAKAKIRGKQVSQWPYAPSMTIFSSRGPNPVVPDIIKPDITAPGTQILAGYSPTSYEDYDVQGEYFAAIQGTSMSSPEVAGAFALLKQVHPEWSAAAARSAIMTSAYQDVKDNDRVSAADPFDMGSGHLNLGEPQVKKYKHKYTEFQLGLASDNKIPTEQVNTYPNGNTMESTYAWSPGIVYDAGLFEYAAFTCGMEWGVFTSGSCDFLESEGIPFEPWNLNYPSIAISALAGSQTVMRTVTSVGIENFPILYTPEIVAPPGYTVEVSPSSFELDPGESVTYYVTITNVSAPIGEWRFGSLKWSNEGNLYQAYSPIAVRGALFNAPDEVGGSGTSGAASFDVSFGYTGSYAAAPHGLEPATVTSDNVVQDPDQTFDPADGYSNPHSFALSGAAFFRIAMPPEATEQDADLDLYLYDPSGAQVATSTSGGTNELIDIVNPVDGVWTVWVHGWATPGGDSNYDMFTWDISATPGGTLSIDAAPTAAVIATTETVDVSWSGALAGQWHLGAVSHTGDVGLMGLTLVNVDNR